VIIYVAMSTQLFQQPVGASFLLPFVAKLMLLASLCVTFIQSLKRFFETKSLSLPLKE